MSTSNFPDPLEKIFLRVEKESFLRAKEVAREAARPKQDKPYASMTRPDTAPSVPSMNNTNDETGRRASISLTRIGQRLNREAVEGHCEKPPHMPVSPTHFSCATARSNVYQRHLCNESRDSLSTIEVTFDDMDHGHSTQVETIAAKQSLSKTLGSLIPLHKLGRSHSGHGMSYGNILDHPFEVAIQATSETTTELNDEEDTSRGNRESRTEIVACCGKRKKTVSGVVRPITPATTSSQSTLESTSSTSSREKEKYKEALTKRLRLGT